VIQGESPCYCCVRDRGMGQDEICEVVCSIEEEEEERRSGASISTRTHLTPAKFNTLDPPRLPLCQTARLRVLFRPRTSLYGQFCACRQLEEGGGHSCTHALGTAAPLPHTGCTCLTTHFLGSSRRRAAATPFFETRTLCRTLLAVPGSSRPQFMRPPHAPAPHSAVLHHPLLWLPAAPYCLSSSFLSGPCSLQSLPTRLLSSVGVRCCLSISVPVPVPVSLSLSFCLVPCVLCLVSVSLLCVCVSCVWCLGLGLGL